YYTRRGTSNSEANGHECVSIYNWFSSIPSIAKNTYLIEEVNNLMKKISEPQLKLSLCLSESLTLAKKYDLENLKTFCFNELSGYGFMSGIIDNSSEVKFRISTVAVTYLDFQFRQYSTWDSRMVFNELKNHKDVFEVKMFFPDSIYKIEEIIQELSIKPTLCSFKSTARKFLGDSKENDYEVTVYADKDVYDGIYSSIKQRLIDNLINIV
ncbi:AbiTii domain-containing protein, partial [Flavobacterium sp.]